MSAPSPARPIQADRRRPILRFVPSRGNVPTPPRLIRSTTYDDPLDVSRGPLDLRQGDRHKSSSDVFAPCPCLLPRDHGGQTRGRPAAGAIGLCIDASGRTLVPRKSARHARQDPSALRPGRIARAAGRTLCSYSIAALPILDRFFARLRLEAILRDHLPREDRRSRIPTATGLLLLKNLLVSREPLYGLSEWAAGHVPELLGLAPAHLPSLNDDRVGRCLDRLFDADIP